MPLPAAGEENLQTGFTAIIGLAHFNVRFPNTQSVKLVMYIYESLCYACFDSLHYMHICKYSSRVTRVDIRGKAEVLERVLERCLF